MALQPQTHPNAFLMLPLELYSHIFSFVSDNQDLCQICLSSRSFYQEAVPKLYHRVNLTLDEEQVISFAWTMETNRILGTFVEELTIAFWFEAAPAVDGRGRPTSQAFMFTACRKILSAVNNLRALATMVGDHWSEGHAMVLRDCSFRLHTFHNISLNILDVIDFLHRQPTIQRFTHRRPFFMSGETRFPKSFLPNLTSMEADVEILFAFQGPRPLRELFLHYFEGEIEFGTSMLTNLSLFGETLVSLILDRENCNGDVDCPALMGFIGEKLPHLGRLSILDGRIELAENQSVDATFIRFLSSLSLFKKLHTFEYSPASWDISSFWWAVLSRGATQVAREIFSSNPYLREIKFPTTPICVDYISVFPAIAFSKDDMNNIQENPAVLKFGWEDW
ncbi:hypothetical protein JAAARDRAFT_39041 [Jaapia argillacea MUCL 33604]|uniref:F-box domain-containing protein n=1 Tax=Jaapia argillacea MUCL 33604 TaxID=933084 RepID=A0A067PG02_9AGAM|nr:hypothetical protein JAAARDRAFT_39041 [Jaapia argillacea MUCL 33604]